MPEFYGIDVSSENGSLNWSKVSGITFAILRITQKYGIDKEFEKNYEGAVSSGLKVGGYRFSYALTAEESKKEADDVIKALNGRKLDYPVFLDLEWDKQKSLSKSKMSKIINAFKTVIEDAGYKFGIYTGYTFYNNLIADDFKSKCDFWIASVPYDKDDNGTLQDRLRPKIGVGWQYSWKKKISGFGGYLDADVFYKDYSDKEEDALGVTAKDVLQVAKGWIGKNEADGSHKAIIDIYNNHKPLARGYKVKYTDSWCDTFVSAVFISLSATDLIGGTECGVEEHVKLFKKAGIWLEDGTITPKAGDIIAFNWDTAVQPNDGYSDHIGIVENVSGNTITTIEGNYKDSVARRSIPVGYGYIRGFARPKYGEGVKSPEKTTTSSAASSTPEKPITETKTHATVRLNSYNEDVKDLQKALNSLGYNLAVDGKYGMKTYAALTSFQNKNGLVVDGICGPKTWAKIDASITPKSITDIAKEVIAGKWGNAPDRQKNLAAAGYTNYKEIQNEVNRLLL